MSARRRRIPIEKVNLDLEVHVVGGPKRLGDLTAEDFRDLGAAFDLADRGRTFNHDLYSFAMSGMTMGEWTRAKEKGEAPTIPVFNMSRILK